MLHSYETLQPHGAQKLLEFQLRGTGVSHLRQLQLFELPWTKFLNYLYVFVYILINAVHSYVCELGHHLAVYFLFSFLFAKV